MKKYIILAYCLLSFYIVQAQNTPYLQPSFQVLERTYMCATPGKFNVKVYSSQNTISTNTNEPDFADNSIQPICRLAYIEQEVIDTHVRAVFSAQRRQELLGEKITIGLYVNRSTGTVKEIYFKVGIQSKITPMEVYQLENQLRADTYSQTGLETCPEVNVDFVHRSFGFNFE